MKKVFSFSVSNVSFSSGGVYVGAGVEVMVLAMHPFGFASDGNAAHVTRWSWLIPGDPRSRALACLDALEVHGRS